VANRLQATGRDIYGAQLTSRSILELRSRLRPGDSGSALVDKAGVVVGIAFAIAPDKPDVAYALATSELRPLLAGPLTDEVGTGRCTAG
jgi:S1-C subfamily serine protease